MHPGINHNEYMHNKANRPRLFGKSTVDDKGYEAYYEAFSKESRHTLAYHMDQLKWNIQKCMVSENFVRALRDAWAEAKQRPPSPKPEPPAEEETAKEPEEPYVLKRFKAGPRGMTELVKVPLSVCDDHVSRDDDM